MASALDPVELLIIVAVVGAPAIGWLIRHGRGLAAQRKAVWVRTHARVADVSTFEVEERNRSYTTDRFVVVFELPGGERHAADKIGPLDQHQKDILLPDAVVPIRYDARDPDRFEVEWAAIGAGEPAGGPTALVGPDAKAPAKSVYGPR
jgi:hypothetical protein